MNLKDFGDLSSNKRTGTKYGDIGQLEVIGWTGKSPNRDKYYVLKCKVCSKDPELFGEGYFQPLGTNLTKGVIPCGCSKLVYWNEAQQVVRAKRKASSLSYEFITWSEDFRGSDTKMLMLCCEHGLWGTTKLQAMLTIGHGCPVCKAVGTAERERSPESLVAKQIEDKANSLGYTFLGWSEPYVGSYTKCTLKCVEHGVWESTPACNLINGFSKVGCPKCGFIKISESRLMCENQRLLEIVDTAKEKQLVFSGFVGNYSGNTTRLKLTCQKHGMWETCTIANFLRGASCPSCNGHNQKQCYLNIVYDATTPIAVKFGISQNFEQRLSNQNYYSSLNLVNHSVYTFEESEDCKRAEKEVKNTFICGVVDKELLPDGYTETTYLNNIDQILNIFEKHGGKYL